MRVKKISWSFKINTDNDCNAEMYIGLMSGTSLDGIDAALVKFDGDRIQLIETAYRPFSDTLKKSLQALSNDSPILLKQYGKIDTQLGELFAQATNCLLNKANITHTEITAIGSHGHTVCHTPYADTPFSLQIGDPNIIAERTGITTVSDFRRRDMAVKGQGAPLAPVFHQAFFCNLFDLYKQAISVINIGGIANISYLSGHYILGFDTGPGNIFMDFWAQKNINTHYDDCGNWAKSGIADVALVNHLKRDDYFQARPPKSTGKEYFCSAWLEHKLSTFTQCSTKNIQASLCQLTADTITDAIQQHAPLTQRTLICGGGVHNQYLLQLIKNNLNHPVVSTIEHGIDPDYVEAVAFAWLARQTMNKLPCNLMQTTGAKKPVILGGVYYGDTTAVATQNSNKTSNTDSI